MKIKKIILSIILSVLLGYLSGIIVYKIYESDTDEVINSNKIYLLQSGAYSSIDSMKVNTSVSNYVYYNDSGIYKTIIALTKDKNNIDKIKNAYNIDMIINEYYLEDENVNKIINEYDTKLKTIENKEEIIDMVDNMLLTYKEKDGLKLVKTY